MKMKIDIADNFIDVWSKEKGIWERYVKIELEKEHKIPERIIPTSLRGIDNLDEKIEVAHIDTIDAINKINEIIDYLEINNE